MKAEILAVFLGIIILVYLGGRSFSTPLKWVFTVLIRAALGAGAIALINSAGQWVHFSLPMNPYTVLFAGFLGLPGIATLILLNLL